MAYSVYKHTTPNGKIYIGVTSRSLKQRANYNGSGYMGCPLFYKAIQKYGWENIRHETLFKGLSKEEADLKEIELIAAYSCTDPTKGYNVDNGGNTTGTHSEATRQKMSKNIKGKTLGRKLSPETCKKMSEARSGERNWNYGNSLPDLQKKAISEAKKGKYAGANHPRAKRVRCVTTGDEYSTIKEAGQVVGVPYINIIQCIKGTHRRKHAGNKDGVPLAWEYVDEIIERS